MNAFRLKRVLAVNFRCFEDLDMPLEPDLTVLFAENGNGKTALLTALAMGLAPCVRGEAPSATRLDPADDPRQIQGKKGGRAEPAGPCGLTWVAEGGTAPTTAWSTSVHPASRRTTKKHSAITEAMERIRSPGTRWPLFAWYGVNRLQRASATRQRATHTLDRWEGYAGSLEPSLSDAPLLQWLQDEMLGDIARERQNEPKRFFDKAVMEATVRATPGVENAWYDPVRQSPIVRFKAGREAQWAQLSDGYHVFIALVADIARRAVMLNETDGADAPLKVEGVVLIDEIDLHLHPRWQRVALPRLCEAFPSLQFVVSTHSPQVLSSVKNRQVRRLVNGKLIPGKVLVEGRDTNAILRDSMDTDDRDDQGSRMLRELYSAIDGRARSKAEELHARLVDLWGDEDPEIIRTRGLIEAIPRTPIRRKPNRRKPSPRNRR